jgi:DNA-binding HxlR family transcriptional regulator
MMQRQTAYCPVDYAFQRVGGKYKGRILWFLKEGTLRYGELRRTVEGISAKMLTQTLKELEADGLIERKAYPEVPPHVEYTLTDIGWQLIPAIDHLRLWAIEQSNRAVVGAL